MTTSALTGMLDQLTARRTELRARAESSLEHAQRSGREELDARERAMLSELRGLDKRIEELKAEQARAGTHSGILGKVTRSINSAGGGTDDVRRRAASPRPFEVVPGRIRGTGNPRLQQCRQRPARAAVRHPDLPAA